MHRHQWIIFLPNFILYRDFTSRYISYRIVYSVLVGAGHIYIYICVCMCIYMYIYLVNYGSSNTIVLEIPWFTARAAIHRLSPNTALSCNPRSPHPNSTMHPIVCAGYTRESLSRDLRNREQWLRVKAIHVSTLCHGHRTGLHIIM